MARILVPLRFSDGSLVRSLDVLKRKYPESGIDIIRQIAGGDMVRFFHGIARDDLKKLVTDGCDSGKSPKIIAQELAEKVGAKFCDTEDQDTLVSQKDDFISLLKTTEGRLILPRGSYDFDGTFAADKTIEISGLGTDSTVIKIKDLHLNISQESSFIANDIMFSHREHEDGEGVIRIESGIFECTNVLFNGVRIELMTGCSFKATGCSFTEVDTAVIYAYESKVFLDENCKFIKCGMQKKKTVWDQASLKKVILSDWAELSTLFPDVIQKALLDGTQRTSLSLPDDDDYLAYLSNIQEKTKQNMPFWLLADEIGLLQATCLLGTIHLMGITVEKDMMRAVTLFEKAAQSGFSHAQFIISLCYYWGIVVEKDFAKALTLAEEAAKQEHVMAQNFLGYYYFTEKQYAEAVRWFQKPAENGVAYAQKQLGRCFLEGLGIEKNITEAIKWYQKAAELGDMDACCNLGKLYLDGDKIDKDQNEAVKLFRIGAEKGHADSQYALGSCFLEGWGVEKDVRIAKDWLRKAAELGNMDACFFLGTLYFLGNEIGQNLYEAVKLFRIGAEKGHADSQYDLGLCFENGLGIEKNIAEAINWYRMAAEQGHEAATNRYRKII